MLGFIHAYKRYMYASALLLGAIFLCMALGTFSLQDQSFFYSSAGRGVHGVYNVTGPYSAYLISLLLYFFGAAVWLSVPLLVLVSLMITDHVEMRIAWRWLVGMVLLVVGMSALSNYMHRDFYVGITAGGVLGGWVNSLLNYFFDTPVAYGAIYSINFVGIICIVGFSWGRPVIEGARKIVTYTGFFNYYTVVKHACVAPFVRLGSCMQRKSQQLSGSAAVDPLEHLVQKIVRDEAGDEHDHIFRDQFWQQPGNSVTANAADVSPQPELVHSAMPASGLAPVNTKIADAPFVLPPVTLFHSPEISTDLAEREELARSRAKNLEEKLKLFNIIGSVVSITVGPVVTLFEYAPARDVKVSKILMLDDDLALALEAHSLRIIAPIPGRAVVGFEVANAQRQTVHFSDVVTGKVFKQYKGSIPLIIGRDTVGHDMVMDLVDAPHLLVAGSTGSGKSVALNAMLISLLCKVHPDDVRLILIDPKRLEFAPFADIPHLIFPIVTEVTQACLVLRWAVKTMEERYEQLAAAHVRNVADYHKKYGIKAMPYLVVVIDELADLMMTSGREVEELIARLAQMARAAGIHLIIATQRPSVDVITGLIKVNFPSRIACKVISKVDSRTILDHGGAEKLLGKGDMLFLNHKGTLVRAHGAYVKDEEVTAIVAHIKKQRAVVYQQLDLVEPVDDSAYDEDPLYNDVCAYVTSQEQVSISLLQRKFRIGYNRSARLIDTLEARGILMPADGGKFRKVLRTQA